METPSEQILDENPDYIPLSIKVVIFWFYILALSGFFNSISFESGLFKFKVTSFVFACLTLMTAYGLGSKRNISRVTAIALAVIWFLPYIYFTWFVLSNELDIGFYIAGKFDTRESTMMWYIAYSILGAVMQISTIVILLQPQTKRLFSKNLSMNSLGKRGRGEGQEG